MPLVNIIGVTPNNKNFFIGSAFIPSETVEDYKFVFGALAHLYESIEREYPNIDMEALATILGDGDAQQIAAIETVLPDTQYRL
jgi:MULE transposase domain